MLDKCQPLTASVSNLNQKTFQQIYEGVMYIKFINKVVGLHTYCMPLSKGLLDTIEIELPQSWVHRFGMDKFVNQPECPTMINIILGRNFLAHFKPIKIATFGLITLVKSQITEKLFLEGAVKISLNYNFNSATNVSGMNASVREVTLNPIGQSQDPTVQSYQDSANVSTTGVANLSHGDERVTLLACKSAILPSDSLFLHMTSLHDPLMVPSGCDACVIQKCTTCLSSFKGLFKSPNEEYEVGLLREGIKLTDKGWHTDLVANEEMLSTLPSYYRETLTYMEKFEGKLIKGSPHILGQFNAIMSKYISQGLFTPLEPSMETQGSYTPLNYSLKAGPPQEPKVRVVYNASWQPQGPRKPSFNDCLLAGCSLNQKLATVLARMRAYRCIAVNDINNAYNCVTLDPQFSQYLKILWKGAQGICPENLNKPWKTYVPTAMLFGVKSAQSIFGLARVLSCQEFIEPKCPRVAYQIAYESYTDNILLGSHEGVEDITTMMGIAEEGLNKANMHLKEWAVTGSNGQEVEFTSTETGALGLFWDPKEDIMKIKLRVNLGGKRGISEMKIVPLLPTRKLMIF